MKNILRYVFVAFIFLIIFVTKVSAVDIVENKSDAIITTEIKNAKIVSQDGNIINLSFIISNKEGVQAGVRYGVQLVKKEGGFVVDEYVGKEILSIDQNSFIEKEIVYNAPSISGEYQVFINLSNEGGRTLGIGYAGIVNLISSKKALEILPETCSLSISSEKDKKYNLSEGVDIAETEDLILNCTVYNPINQSVTAIPSFQTHYRTLFGEIVPQTEVKNESITFNSQEKKTVSILLPKALSPQAYDVKVVLQTGQIDSNPIVAHYVIQGSSATIQSFSFDKSGYKMGDTANISLALTPSADSFPQSRADNSKSSVSGAKLIIDVLNDKGKQCIKAIDQDATDLFNKELQIPVRMKANCENFTAVVMIKDASGNTLDEKSFTFVTSENDKEKSNSNNMIYIILGLLVVGGVIVYFINLKKKENEKTI